jgi:hypothetical protein
VLHPQVLEQRVQPLLDLARLTAAAGGVELQLQHRAHVLGHVELAKDRRLLRQVTQAQARAAVDGHVLDRPAVDGDVAGAGAHQAHDHVERGGLAGAVGAEQTDHLALATVSETSLTTLRLP